MHVLLTAPVYQSSKAVPCCMSCIDIGSADAHSMRLRNGLKKLSVSYHPLHAHCRSLGTAHQGLHIERAPLNTSHYCATSSLAHIRAHCDGCMPSGQLIGRHLLGLGCPLSGLHGTG